MGQVFLANSIFPLYTWCQRMVALLQNING